jgi:hypothetical protein
VLAKQAQQDKEPDPVAELERAQYEYAMVAGTTSRRVTAVELRKKALLIYEEALDLFD